MNIISTGGGSDAIENLKIRISSIYSNEKI